MTGVEKSAQAETVPPTAQESEEPVSSGALATYLTLVCDAINWAIVMPLCVQQLRGPKNEVAYRVLVFPPGTTSYDEANVLAGGTGNTPAAAVVGAFLHYRGRVAAN